MVSMVVIGLGWAKWTIISHSSSVSSCCANCGDGLYNVGDKPSMGALTPRKSSSSESKRSIFFEVDTFTFPLFLFQTGSPFSSFFSVRW